MRTMSVKDKMTFDQSLILAIAPIAVTALLAGLLVPLVLKNVEARKAISLKRLEASLARQSKIIESQACLLDELTTALWAWRYQVMRLTYCGAEQSQAALDAAWNAYDTANWDSLHAIKVQTTRARRLVSNTAYVALTTRYEEIVEVNRRLGEAMKLDADVRRRELEEMNHEIFTRISKNIDDSLHMVAEEVRLISPDAMN
jgi:hypothetical protein